MVYAHYCDKCDVIFDVVCSHEHASWTKTCNICGNKECGRAGLAGVTPPALGPMERWSQALGCPRSQQAEMKRAMEANGATDVRFHPTTGACYVKNKSHERALLRSRGMVRF